MTTKSLLLISGTAKGGAKGKIARNVGMEEGSFSNLFESKVKKGLYFNLKGGEKR